MLLSRSWLPPLPLVRGPILLRLAVLTLLPLSVLFFWVSSYVDVDAAPFAWSSLTPFRGKPPLRMPIARPLKPLQKRVACTGPRGKFLSASSDDELISVSLPRCKNMKPRSFFFFFFTPHWSCLASCETWLER